MGVIDCGLSGTVAKTDALRLSLYYCWRDSEKFRHIEAIGVNPHYTIHASIILNNSFFTFEQ